MKIRVHRPISSPGYLAPGLMAVGALLLSCNFFTSLVQEVGLSAVSVDSPAVAAEEGEAAPDLVGAPMTEAEGGEPDQGEIAKAESPDGPINPLTGLPVDDPARLALPPRAIKVSNFPVQGRPHAGLSYADLVAEYFIGEGMTRFLAIYYGTDSPRVGPIRSGRLIDGELTRMYGGVLGLKGADPYVLNQLELLLPGRVFSAKPASCPALCPETISHTYGTFADSAAFSEYAASKGADPGPPSLAGTIFDPNPPSGGEQAQRLWIFFANLNQVAWDFDAAQGAYLRSQDNADAVLRPMPDRLTGDTLVFANVVILFAPHNFLSPTLIDVDLWHQSGRPALILRDGRMYRGTWAAPSTDGPLQFFHADGSPFALKPGSTWLEIVGMGSEVSQTGGGSWKVRFRP